MRHCDVWVRFAVRLGADRRLPSTGMQRRRQRLCEFCRDPMPADAPVQSKYCSRSHRQRAYEARQSAETAQLRRRVRALRRQVVAYDDAIKRVSQHPVYGKEVGDALLGAYMALPDELGWENRVWTFTT